MKQHNFPFLHTRAPELAGKTAPVSGDMQTQDEREEDGAQILLSTIEKVGEERGCTDILVNGTQLWADFGQGLIRCSLAAQVRAEDVRSLAVRLAALADRRLDRASPIVDATMPQGWRLHAVIPPIATPDTLISIRIPRHYYMSLEDFIRVGWHPRLIELLKRLVDIKANVIISGATGSGKTTLLSAALGQASPRERLICIEEVSEIHTQHPHCVHLQERDANIENVGSLGLSELVKAAMRMRPDRIILGECRGSEVREVMSALNTGHSGCWATIHANSAADVPARLHALGALAGMSAAQVRVQALSAFDAVIHMERGGDGIRAVTQIGVFRGNEKELTCEAVVNCEDRGLVVLDEDAVRAWGIHARD